VFAWDKQVSDNNTMEYRLWKSAVFIPEFSNYCQKPKPMYLFSLRLETNNLILEWLLTSVRCCLHQSGSDNERCTLKEPIEVAAQFNSLTVLRLMVITSKSLSKVTGFLWFSVKRYVNT
jgi:hypothetical protein